MTLQAHDHRHFAEQVEQIIEQVDQTGPDSRLSVIVQLTPDPELVDFLRETAVTRHQRQSIITARDLLPPRNSTTTAVPGKIRVRSKQPSGRSLSVMSAPFYDKYAVERESLAVRQQGVFSQTIHSDWVQQTIPRAKKSKKTPRVVIPVHFATSSSLVLNLTRDQLSELPNQIPTVAEIYPNRSARVPSTSKSAELPAIVADNKRYTWGVSRTGALSTWGAFGARGEDVIVAVLDTGIDPKHPDLRGRLAGFVEFDADGRKVKEGVKHAFDDNGHGTHCAGVICGNNDSGRWIGMAPATKIVSVKVLTKGAGTDAQILAGLDWAIRESKASIISMSLGALRLSADVLDTYTQAVFNANRAGIPVIVAVGNEGSQTTGSPGNDYFAFTVGATDGEDRAAGFSGGRTQVIEQSRYLDIRDLPLVYSKPDVTAPGVAVYSSVPNGKREAWNGSSMATPHVAGAMALLLSPEFQVKDLEGMKRTDVLQALVISTVRELGEAGQNHRFGYGRIDVLRACSYAKDLGY